MYKKRLQGKERAEMGKFFRDIRERGRWKRDKSDEGQLPIFEDKEERQLSGGTYKNNMLILILSKLTKLNLTNLTNLT